MNQATRQIPERLMPDDRQQFLEVTLSADDPWLAYDSWGIELACKLITLGYPVDIERMIDEAKSWEPGCEGIDRLHSMLMVYNRALSIAKSSVNAGLLKNPDTPANWLTWAKRKGYDVAHLESMAAPVVAGASDDEETKEQRQDRRLQACIEAGLPMDTKAALLRLPDGVGKVAETEGVKRQSFSTDIKAALQRREAARKESGTVHRA